VLRDSNYARTQYRAQRCNTRASRSDTEQVWKCDELAEKAGDSKLSRSDSKLLARQTMLKLECRSHHQVDRVAGVRSRSQALVRMQ